MPPLLADRCAPDAVATFGSAGVVRYDDCGRRKRDAAPLHGRTAMEGATFLTRVVLENYKSIAHCDVRLGPLNYLVGPNGAGKSNFLDAIRFVADALRHSVGQA